MFSWSVSQELGLEEGGGSLSVLGRSPFNKDKLSIEELRQAKEQMSEKVASYSEEKVASLGWDVSTQGYRMSLSSVGLRMVGDFCD